MKPKMSPARQHIENAFHNVCRGASDQRRHHATRSALNNAICGGMRFDPDDFNNLSKSIGIGAFTGNERANDIDGFYSLACGKERASANPSAVAALEKFLGREPFIWAEDRTPARLHVGSQFKWKGERVTVTSFAADQKSLTACSYKRELDYESKKLAVGSECYFGGDRRLIEAVADLGDGVVAVRFSAKVRYEPEKVAKRFQITAAELTKLRKGSEARVRKYKKAFAACQTLDELEACRIEATAEGADVYRHFDLEVLTEAHRNAKAWIESAPERERNAARAAEMEAANQRYVAKSAAEASARLERWMAGEDVRDYLGAEIKVRIKGGFVEVSNGNKVTLDAARLTLAFVKRNRAKGWEANGTTYDVDAFPLRRISSEGVQIGCTLISWPEVDRCAELLKSEK
jgi:hypothetical protein